MVYLRAFSDGVDGFTTLVGEVDGRAVKTRVATETIAALDDAAAPAFVVTALCAADAVRERSWWTDLDA